MTENARRTYRVEATRSGSWWALHAVGVEFGYSQARRLDQAESAIREALAIVLGVSEDSFDIDLHARLEDALQARVDEARAARAAAERAELAAREAQLAAVAELRESGLTTRDIGGLLGLSHQRVAQIAGAAHSALREDRAELQPLSPS